MDEKNRFLREGERGQSVSREASPESSNRRKHEHLEYANDSQMDMASYRGEFNYEPLFSAHPAKNAMPAPRPFLGKTLQAPLWISSMTGGTGAARHINQNLARAAREFGLGFGLGSCRPLLEKTEDFHRDFHLREILGDEVPFMANLGLAQVEKLLMRGEYRRIEEMLQGLSADGLIVHINPLQEWFQEGGDRFQRAPLSTLDELLEKTSYPVMVKEVGQGMGPKSLKALMERPFAAIEFGALGGTNFSLLEKKRSQNQQVIRPGDGLSQVGHTAKEMITLILAIIDELDTAGKTISCKQFVISGGISDPLQGFGLVEKLTRGTSVPLSVVFGQARSFLAHATGDYQQLREYCEEVMQTLSMAEHFLEVK